MSLYLQRQNFVLRINRPDGSLYEVPTDKLIQATNEFDRIIKLFNNFEVDIAELLGMRNLSAFIGELFATCLRKQCPDSLYKNPNQDGYPDLLILDYCGNTYYQTLLGQLKDKQPFSNFKTGGIEVKATCGNTPTDKTLQRKGLSKPGLGERRCRLLNSYAHHRQTNCLIGILWDFNATSRIPEITALFFSNELTMNDWGDIVQPKAGGGRTTSVSIMNRAGIKKMYDGWLLVQRDTELMSFLNKYNKGTLIKP
jgi:hypothetical protein